MKIARPSSPVPVSPALARFFGARRVLAFTGGALAALLAASGPAAASEQGNLGASSTGRVGISLVIRKDYACAPAPDAATADADGVVRVTLDPCGESDCLKAARSGGFCTLNGRPVSP
jgi:hypothetical protein